MSRGGSSRKSLYLKLLGAVGYDGYEYDRPYGFDPMGMSDMGGGFMDTNAGGPGSATKPEKKVRT